MNYKKFAVVFAGCGVYDGAEIHEAVATLLAIDKTGSSYQCFAPDINQFHVVNHLNGEVMNETRNVLTEAARIARGNIKALKTFVPEHFDAIIFPGGFGVAKNFCTYAIDGADFLTNPIVEKTIKKAHKVGLPIGALCISPVLISAFIPNVKLTVGTDQGAIAAIESLGGQHQQALGSEIVIDTENKIVSTPCYMLDSPISTVFEAADKLVDALIKLC